MVAFVSRGLGCKGRSSDVNAQADNGRTALFNANKHPEAANILLEAGATR